MNETTAVEPANPYLPRGHSGLGVASFAIGLALLVALVAVISIQQYRADKKPLLPTLYPLIGRSNPDNVKFARLQKIQDACFYFIAAGWPVGFLLGLMGMLQGGRKRLYPAVGVLLHGAMAFWMMVLKLAT
jgi:hypothetical protein